MQGAGAETTVRHPRLPASLAQARIHAELGNRALAKAHHARFLDLWATADVELQPLVGQGRAELEGL